jgi:DNA-binding CsgD family transcriptional regulator
MTLGWTGEDVIGRDAGELMEVKDLFGNRLCPHHCGLHEMARRGEPFQTVCLFLKAKNGEYHQFFGSVSAVAAETHDRDAKRKQRGWDLVFRLQQERRRQTAGALIERLLHRQAALPVPASAPDGQPPQLTARQKEVLSLLAEGCEPPRIAKRLGVSVNTVRNHIQRILMNLDCHSQANAVAIAIRQGLI